MSLTPSLQRIEAPHAPGLLAELTAGLAAGGDLTERLQAYLAPVLQVCGAEAGALRVLSADGRRFELVAEHGLRPAVRDAALSVGHDCGVCGFAAGTQDLAWTDSATGCAWRAHAARPGAGGRQVLAVPLVHGGEVLGIYTLFFGAGSAPLPPQVKALLRTLGELLGLALHQMRLERQALNAAVRAERQAMSADLHDSISQTLVYAKMRLSLLESALESGDEAVARRCCADLRASLGDAHSGLRDLLGHLREPVDPGGFRHAIHLMRTLLRQVAEIELSVQDGEPQLQLSAAQDRQVHRIVQEALSNVARHSGARRAWIRIARQGLQLEIVVEDDGRGLPPAPPGSAGTHYGMDIMRERAALLGGTLEFAPRPGGGTRVGLRFPLAPAAPTAATAAPA